MVTKAATCQEPGNALVYCSTCHKILNSHKELPVTDHKAVIDKAVAPTCEESGKTEGSHCQTCGKVLKEQKEIPALGHTETIDPAVAATCEEAGKNPGHVIAGPIRKTYSGGYVLYLTKAVYMNRSIAGYVQIELNLDEIYEGEQDLSNLNVGNQGYCIVKDIDGTTVMADARNEKEEISFSSKDVSGCEVVWSYEVEGGSPKKTQKLVA